ncbi:MULTISPECIES: VWA domain-containing protein [unclassified Actinotalea]|uniref:vWA domain-containing protein n=1 Tax=unclassified Actinotalea TaxID=2638618 RepID=UPI0015F3FBDA|nr:MULTISPECIES: VWA domain-containing protein [unclassified Actinotalea]
MTLRPLIPLWLLLLVLLPVLAFAVRQAVAGPAATRGRWWLRAGTVVAVTALGLGPSVPAVTDQQVGVAVDVFFVVDRTGSMAAEDWSADGLPRLDGVRHDLPAIVGAMPGARYSIIAWDSQASRQLPLTTDARAVRSWTQTVRQEATDFSTGSLVDRPLEPLSRALTGAQERNPGHVRLVFFLSDGEQTTDGVPESYEALAPLIDGGAVLGYGTAEGGRMRSYDGSLDPAPDAPYIVDPDTGSEAVSVIDEAALQTVADQLGVPYAHRGGPDDVAPLLEGIDPEEIATDGRRDTHLWRAMTWPLALVVAGLLGAEAWLTARGWVPLRRGRADA